MKNSNNNNNNTFDVHFLFHIANINNAKYQMGPMD